MYDDPRAFKIYTDGSVLKNPGGAGGIAGIIEYPDDLGKPYETIFAEGYKSSTNNRMELLACIKGLQYARMNKNKISGRRVILVTDSDYVYSYHKYAEQWKKLRWLNKDGRPIENSDLWNKFLTEWRKTGIEIQLIKGKSNEITKAVDKLAKKEVSLPNRVDDGYRPGRVTPKMAGEKTADIFPAKGQTLLIRIYRRNYYKRNKQTKIYFNIFSESKNDYYGNYFAYILDGQAIHTRKCYKVTFNDNMNNPIVNKYNVKRCPLKK